MMDKDREVTAVFEKIEIYMIVLSGEQFGLSPEEPEDIDSGMFDWADTMDTEIFDVHQYDEDHVGNDREGQVFDDLVAEINSKTATNGVTYIMMASHSHGGGSIPNLATRLATDPGMVIDDDAVFFVLMTAYVDAIKEDDIAPETAFPAGSTSHVNLYQLNGVIDGGPVARAQPNWDVNGVALPCVNNRAMVISTIVLWCTAS